MSAEGKKRGYRASLVKRRRPRSDKPQEGGARSGVRIEGGRIEAKPAQQPTARDLQAELRRETRARIEAERVAVRRIEATTAAWNEELASTVPSLGAVVSRAVASIVGEAPREDVVVTALRRELARVRGEHRPVLRVSAAEDASWIDRVAERGRTGRTPFELRRDETLTPGKCVLELGARRVDLSPETQLAAFDEKVRSGVGAAPPRAVPPLPAVAPLPDEAASPPAGLASAPEPVASRAEKAAASPVPERAEAPSAMSEIRGADKVENAETDRQSSSESAPAKPAARGTSPRARVSVSRPTRKAAAPGDASKSVREDPPEQVRAASPQPTASEARSAKARKRAEEGPETSGRTPVESPRRDKPAARQGKRGASDESVPLDDFDALDLGEDAARFRGIVPPSIENDRPWTPSASRPPLPEGERGSRAVAALRERVVREAGALRLSSSGEDGSLPEALVEDGTEDVDFPPFVSAARKFRTADATPDGPAVPEKTVEPETAPEPAREPAELPGEIIRRAIKGRSGDASEPPSAAKSEPSKPEPVNAAAEPARTASEGERGAKLRLPPRIAKLIDEARGR